MLQTRPIIPIVIGYILGIIIGLYFKISIVLIFLGFYIIKILLRIYKATSEKIKRKNEDKKVRKLKLISIKRCFRYVKIIFNKKVILIIVVSSIISNTIIHYQNNKYDNLYNFEDDEKILVTGKIISNKKEKEYKDIYKIKVEKVNNKDNFKNTNLYLYVKSNKKIEFKYGDKIEISGTFTKGEVQRNYKGFNYREYLKTVKVYGILTLDKYKVIYVNANNFIRTFSNNIFLNIKNKVNENLSKEISSIVLGITLGYTEEIDENIKIQFSSCNISHILAVSGMHVGYIMIFMQKICDNILGKRKSKTFISIILVFYMILCGFSPSVVRAGISGIIILMAGVVHRKNNLWNNICLSLLIILIYNPFLIRNVGLLLSYGGTIGIIIVSENIENFFFLIEENYEEKNKRKRKLIKLGKRTRKLYNKIKENIIITLSVMIVILPIIVNTFNVIPCISIILSLIISSIIAPIIIMCFIYIISINIININIFSNIINYIISMLLKIVEIGDKIPMNKALFITPNIFEICIYYIISLVGITLFRIYHTRNNSITEIRVKNIISLLQYRFREKIQKIGQEKYKKIIAFLICGVFLSICIFNTYIPRKLRIHFIDVGQGDCTFIVTPRNNRILLDGGGSEFSSYSVGEKILLPYLLDRRILKIDYMIFSHFDSDHCEGLLYIMKKIKVDNVVIANQYETSENYKKFIEIANRKRTNVIIAEAGDRVTIEKNLFFDVLWPDKNNMISENAINNNSLVCKLNYKRFSILFTGDVEEIAEKAILNKYKKSNGNILKSTVLKVAHHGSKTSSIKEFLDKVKPLYALIGVGKNNKFGHPSDNTIKKLKYINTIVYRTDINGEIILTTDGEKIWKKTLVKSK